MSMFLEFGRMLLALAFVIVLIWGLAKVARRGQSGGFRRRGPLDDSRVEILSRRSLSRTSSIAVVRIGDRTLVVGSTPQSVTLISELTATEATPPSPTPMTGSPWMALPEQSTSAWDAFMNRLRAATTRH